MQTTKHQILELLKRTGSATIDEAAGALFIASMTARQHLLGLERDGLVQSDRVRRSNGRPHFVFYLTTKGDEMFPRRFDLLAGILLDLAGSLSAQDIDGLTPEEKRSLLVMRAADRLAEDFRFPVEGRSLEERVDQLTGVLHRIGGFAEWRKVPEGYEVRDYNCVFARLLASQSDGCLGHLRLITHLLQWPARHEVFVQGRVQCCRYVVSPDATGAEEGLLLNA
jgi:predicted ArsR family transcriptional regulator